MRRIGGPAKIDFSENLTLRSRLRRKCKPVFCAENRPRYVAPQGCGERCHDKGVRNVVSLKSPKAAVWRIVERSGDSKAKAQGRGAVGRAMSHGDEVATSMLQRYAGNVPGT